MSSPGPSIPFHRKAIYGLIVGAALFALTEGVARVVLLMLGPGRAPLLIEPVGDGRPEDVAALTELMYVPDERLLFRLRPNLSLPTTHDPRIFDVRTNSLGLRGAEIARAKPPGTVRVLCVGDSCTFGLGARTDETYPAQLEQRLRPARPDTHVEVVNAGMPGYTSYQGRVFLETEGLALAPDFVVVALGFNDTIDAQPAPRRQFAGGRPLSDREYGAALRRRSRLAIVQLAGRLVGHPAVGTNPSATSAKPRVSLDEYAENLVAIIERCRENNARPIVVLWPILAQARQRELTRPRQRDVRCYQEVAAAVARAQGAAVVDLISLVAGRDDVFTDVVHFNAVGYRLVADAVAAELLRRSAGSSADG